MKFQYEVKVSDLDAATPIIFEIPIQRWILRFTMITFGVLGAVIGAHLALKLFGTWVASVIAGPILAFAGAWFARWLSWTIQRLVLRSLSTRGGSQATLGSLSLEIDDAGIRESSSTGALSVHWTANPKWRRTTEHCMIDVLPSGWIIVPLRDLSADEQTALFAELARRIPTPAL